MKRLAEIDQRKAELRGMLEDVSRDFGQDELSRIEGELNSLNAEKESLQKRFSLAKNIQEGSAAAQTIETVKKRTYGSVEEQRMELRSTPEYHQAFFKMLRNPQDREGNSLSQREKNAIMEYRDLSTGAASAGAAVPTQTYNTIMERLRQQTVLYPLVQVTNIPGNLNFPVQNALAAASWKTEGAATTYVDDTLSSVSLVGKELIKAVSVTKAAATMAIDAFESFVVNQITRQMAIAIENAIMTGAGSATVPFGISTSITWTNNTNSINLASGVPTYDTFLDALALLPTMYHQNAVIVANRATLFGVIRKIKDTAGNPLFAYTANSPAPTTPSSFVPPANILGYRVILNDYCPDKNIFIFDPSYYAINFSSPIELMSSDHARFDTGQTVYRGIAVLDGRPLLTEAYVRINWP